MPENRVTYCEWVDLVSDHPNRWLEFKEGHPGGEPRGPYRVPLSPDLITWLTVSEPQRMERAFHVLRVHIGEEHEKGGCPSVVRARQ